VTAVLHTIGRDLKQNVHVHVIISAGGLKLSEKAERHNRFNQENFFMLTITHFTQCFTALISNCFLKPVKYAG
jgi:hypothetical protein